MRYLGIAAPPMPVPPDIPQTVTLLCAPKKRGDAERIEPIGTGFFVGMPGAVPGVIHPHVVTARHTVVAAFHHYGALYARVTVDGALVDVPMADWVIPDAVADDIAVSYFPYGGRMCWSTTRFLSEADEQPYLGDNVYFIGMLKWVPDMAASNVPMVRSGTLGAMNQSGIPVKMPDHVKIRMRGHLIDCRAYRGFSGSPCFVQTPNGHTWLLGVISAHFDASDQIPFESDLIEVPIHAGVGVVAPVELLNQLLADESLVTMRKQKEEQIIQRSEGDAQAATADADVPDEFERFEDLTRKVLQVPKSEVDEKRKNA